MLQAETATAASILLACQLWRDLLHIVYKASLAHSHFPDLALLHMQVGEDMLLQLDGMQECNGCQRLGLWRKCQRCRAVRYCGRTCQKADWRSHKPQCAELQ